jgi:hypothetical protein
VCCGGRVPPTVDMAGYLVAAAVVVCCTTVHGTSRPCCCKYVSSVQAGRQQYSEGWQRGISRPQAVRPFQKSYSFAKGLLISQYWPPR